MDRPLWHDVLVTTGERDLGGSARASGISGPRDLVVREVILPKRRVFLPSNLQLVLQRQCGLQPERCTLAPAGGASRCRPTLRSNPTSVEESAAAEQQHYEEDDD